MLQYFTSGGINVAYFENQSLTTKINLVIAIGHQGMGDVHLWDAEKWIRPLELLEWRDGFSYIRLGEDFPPPRCH